MTTILILTNSLDNPHIGAVSQYIDSGVDHIIRVDTDLLIQGQCSISFDYSNGSILYKQLGEITDLRSIDSVWYRKPFGFSQTYGFLESIQDPVQRSIVDKEIHDVLNGLCFLLHDKFWINHPSSIHTARIKPYQLSIAKRIGLPMPDTLITSDPDAARQFCLEAPTVFKPVSVSSLDLDDTGYMIETTLMTDELIDSLGLIKSQPIILQRFIRKTSELRVTCIGKQIFVARQIPQETMPRVVDWRSLQESGSRYVIDYTLPEDIERKVRSLLTSLGLGFAAIDFAIDEIGDLYFLEANPNGQWLGYTDEIGLPAAAHMARCLVEKSLL